jgi:ABC-type transporter Mla subunit MlaD
MSHPGASAMAALQRLLHEYAATCSGDAGQRVAQALLQLRRLADAGAGLFAEHPGLQRQLAAMAVESPQHLAHEFLSGHWQPLHSAEVLVAFASAGAEWIGSATPIENIDALSVPGKVLPLLRHATRACGVTCSSAMARVCRRQRIWRRWMRRPG